MRFVFRAFLALLLAVVLARTAHAMTVAPPVFDFDVAPGTSHQDKITLINDTSERETFTLSVENFKAEGEDGRQSYIQEERPTGLASWVHVAQPTLELGPGESREFSFLIAVPEGAEPGGHYATMFFTRGAGRGNGSGVGVAEQIGVLLLVRVPGDIRESLKIASFRADGAQTKNRLPVTFELRLENSGSVHLRPSGSIVIRNVFGNIVARLSGNPKNSAVLPGSIRRIEMAWTKTDVVSSGGFVQETINEWRNFGFGPYTASVDMTYGSRGDSLQGAQVKFWIIPWHLLIALGGLLVMLVIVMKIYNALLIRSVLKNGRERT